MLRKQPGIKLRIVENEKDAKSNVFEYIQICHLSLTMCIYAEIVRKL